MKWQFQLNHRTLSWENTIFREREIIDEYLEDTPSLRQFLDSDEWLTKAYNRAKKLAIKETKLDASKFPHCPYTLKELLYESFFPEATTGS